MLTAWLAALAYPAGVSAANDQPTPRGIAPPTRIPYVATANSAPAGEPLAMAQIPREVRRAVVADAAKRFKVAASAVVLTHAEQVTWSDGSLGCPEPGRVYAQMLVGGFRVVAKTSGGELTYNTDARGTVKSCAIAPAIRRLKDPPAVDTEPTPYPPPASPER